jgi:hypothetical protein
LALTEHLIDLQILKTTLTVWTLASDTDYGTEARVFTNERDAHLAILDHEALSLYDADKSRLLSALDDPEADFYELLDTLKYYKDTFTVDQHQLTIEVA